MQETQTETSNPSEKLEKLASDAAQEKGAASFMDPGAKKKRGRPKGSVKKETEAPRAREPDAILPPPDMEKERETLKPVLAPVFNLMSMAGVKIAEDEKAAIPEATQVMMTHCASGCVAKYLPGISQHADAICLSLMMSNWAMTVWLLRRENLARMREEIREKQNGMAPVALHS